MEQVEVLSSPGSERPPSRVLAMARRRPRSLISLGLAALLGAGIVATIRAGPPEQQLANAWADAIRDHDCPRVADLFHYDDPTVRANTVAVCLRRGHDTELTGFEVTGIVSAPVGVAVPPGASEVATVSYAVVLTIPGRELPEEGSLILARYDGLWAIVADS